MSESKHTPGEWEVIGGSVFAVTGRYYDRPVARIGVPLDKNDNRVAELEANAHLIAAAPDMLEALKAAMPYVARYESAHASNEALDVLGMIDAAIAKATGAA